MNKRKEKIIENSLKLLINWLGKNGLEGYDPYDIKAHPLIGKIIKAGNKNFLFEILREGLFELFLMFPGASRKFFRIKPAINPKAVGLIARSFTDLFKLYGDEKFLIKAKEYLAWLEGNYAPNYEGKGWGYPFDWYAKEVVPAGTPNGIVTTTVGDAFFEMYRLTGESKYLETCIEICRFLISLPIDNISDDQICFSYTPVFVNHVHNLNLFVAEFLIRIGEETGNEDWIEPGIKAIDYTLANQEEDGSFDYDGWPEKLRGFKDNYHTAFVLRKLFDIYKLTNREIVKESLTRGYNFYINNFFEDGKIPKFRPEKKYRIDIHSCAESINCLSELSPLFPEGLNIALNVAEWTIENLQDDEGYFYHGIFKSKITHKEFVSKFPYVRWAEAWMLKGLSNLLLKLKS